MKDAIFNGLPVLGNTGRTVKINVTQEFSTYEYAKGIGWIDCIPF